jgi:hypothetical protein
MKRAILCPLWAILSVFVLLLGVNMLTVFAQAQTNPANSGRLTYSVPLEPDQLHLVSSSTFTSYLPILLKPPLPSPKKGFGAHGSPACADLSTLRASWYHNWGVSPDPNCGSEYNNRFVPMIYNGNSMPLLPIAVANAQASGWLMGFSEPNLAIHGNLTPAQGAILWKQIEDAVSGTGIKLVSPAPNQWNPGQNGQVYGHQWTWAMVDEFEARYGRKPRFDAIGWNFYASSLNEMLTFLNDRRIEALIRGYDVPFWLFEYGGSCVSGSDAQIQSIMLTATPWLEATPWIDRYAWFATRLTRASDASGNDYTKCSLIDANNGAITPLGQLYWSLGL